ncbi:hypothetical protein FB451DRAFT_1571328 [Mycena latifolia]|nr:hypothetical protein FB451DRAFT_1571328 [Mycena latifolia]
MHSYYSPRFSLPSNYMIPYWNAENVYTVVPNEASASMALGDDACNASQSFPALLAAANDIRLSWRAPAGVSREICAANDAEYSTSIKDVSPLGGAPSARLFHAEFSTHYFMALGGDFRDVYLSFVAERAAHTLCGDPLNAFKSHGGLARHTDESTARQRAALIILYCGFTGLVCGFWRLGVPRNTQNAMPARSEGYRSGARGQRRRTDATLSARACAREGQRVCSFQVGALISSIAVCTTTRPDLLEFARAGAAASIPEKARWAGRMAVW